MSAAWADALFEAGLVSELDLAFARLAVRLSGLEGEAAGRVALLSALLSRSRSSEKSSRLELSSLKPDALASLNRRSETGEALDAAALKEALSLFEGLEAKDWLAVLKAAPGLAAQAGADGPPKPLVYDEASESVYLLKLWRAESRVAARVLERAARTKAPQEPALALLERLFPLYGEPAPGEADLQKEAAKTALSGLLSIVTGGPGTGKTSSVAAALCALLAAEPEAKIALCAPTGKAAAQLLASINAQKGLFKAKGVPEALLAKLPSEASTIHRLLQWSPSQERFLKGPQDQLDFDAIVADEASMMPLLQADSLLSATPEGARLVLLGDKDQLASVESGSVFAELCARRGDGFALGKRVVELKKVHRFKAGGGIAALKDAVNAQDVEESWRILASGSGELRLVRLEASSAAKARELLREELARALDESSFKSLSKESDPARAFELFESFRILCSNRRGRFGVDAVNGALLELAFGRRAAEALNGLQGLPLIVERNSYSLGLNNGDVGLVLPAKRGLEAFFRSGEASFRSVPLPLLPERGPAFAMSVHKAQGSGFRHAFAILPPDPLNPLLSKELLYTAITRAKERLTLLCSEASFKAAVARRAERSSGLAEALLRA